jgi:hypothetical protein
MRAMAMAEVIVLRSTASDGGPSGPVDAPDVPAPGGAGSAGTGGPDGASPGGGTPAAPDAAAWPAAWLPALLAQHEEEAEADDGVHRYRGARVLYTSGCRYIDVTGAPTDPTSVRLTVVWGEDVPPAEDRAALVTWLATQASAAGWEPTETDELVGSVVVSRYVPTETVLDVDVQPQAVRHDWEPLAQERSYGSRTSGRRT